MKTEIEAEIHGWMHPEKKINKTSNIHLFSSALSNNDRHQRQQPDKNRKNTFLNVSRDWTKQNVHWTVISLCSSVLCSFGGSFGDTVLRWNREQNILNGFDKVRDKKYNFSFIQISAIRLCVYRVDGERGGEQTFFSPFQICSSLNPLN